MPKYCSVKPKGTYEWINATIDFPPAGVRPPRAGNNDTGAKGKLKCAGCRLSKIKCIYDYPNLNSFCGNCLRRGLPCGEKLPGPRAQADAGALVLAEDRGPAELRKYIRLYERFQRLRPRDGPDEIDKLVELVENGTLKEENGVFVVQGSEDSEMSDTSEIDNHTIADIVDWESNSYNTDRFPVSEFGEGYLSVVAIAETMTTEKAMKSRSEIPRQFNPLVGTAPIPWHQQPLSGNPGFRELDFTFPLVTPFGEGLGMIKYS